MPCAVSGAHPTGTQYLVGGNVKFIVGLASFSCPPVRPLAFSTAKSEFLAVTGQMVRPDDSAIAMMPAPKPKMGLGKNLACDGRAGLLGGPATGRKLVKGAAIAVTRKAESYLK